MKIEMFLTKSTDLEIPTYSERSNFLSCPFERLLNLGCRYVGTMYVYSV